MAKASITAKTKFRYTKRQRRLREGVKHQRDIVKKNKELAKLVEKSSYKVYKNGTSSKVQKAGVFGGSREHARRYGFDWMMSAHGKRIKDIAAQQIRDGLLASMKEILQLALERKNWTNATGNAMASFMVGVYDWSSNLYTKNLTSYAYGEKKPKPRLRPGVGVTKNGLHIGRRYKVGGKDNTYKIMDSILTDPGYDGEGYAAAEELLQSVQALLGRVRNGSRHGEYQQAIKVVFPTEYINTQVNFLEGIRSHVVTIVNNNIRAQVQALQNAVNSAPIRDALGRFVKGTPIMNVKRDAHGRFTK